MIHKRLWTWTCCSLATIMFLASCGGTPATQAPEATTAPAAGEATEAPAADEATEEAATEGDATEEAAAEETPAAGGEAGTLRLLWWQAPTILNTHLSSGTKDFDASRVTIEPLATHDADGNMQLVLAAEEPTVENGLLAEDRTSVTWKLKEGVKWSDGEDFTADDVAFTYKFLSDEATAAATAGTYDTVVSVEAVDDLTVKVTFSQPNPAWYLPFTNREGGILPEHVFADYVGEKAREAPANLMPIGTGPYAVTEFRPQDIVIYEPNPFWRDGVENLAFDRVELKGGGDATSAARAVLQTGDVDFAWNLQVEAQVLNQLAESGSGKLIITPGGAVERVLLNRADPNVETADGERASLETPHPFFDDKQVRQAFALAMDRNTVAEQLYGPAGDATCNILVAPPQYASDTQFDTCDFNLEQAAQLLDEAGWTDTDGDSYRDKDGVKMSVVYQTSVNPLRQSTQEIIKQALESIGVQVELKSVDAGIFFSGDPVNPDGFRQFFTDVEMYTNEPDLEPTAYMQNFTCAEVSSKANQWQGNNPQRFCSEEYDGLYTQLQGTLDPAEREQLFKQMNDLLIEDVAIVSLVARPDVDGASADLKGLNITPWDSQLWNIGEWSK